MLGTSALDACDIYTTERIKFDYMTDIALMNRTDVRKMIALYVSVPQTHCVNTTRLPLWQSHNRLVVKEFANGVAGVYSCPYESMGEEGLKLLRNTSLGDPLEELD